MDISSDHTVKRRRLSGGKDNELAIDNQLLEKGRSITSSNGGEKDNEDPVIARASDNVGNTGKETSETGRIQLAPVNRFTSGEYTENEASVTNSTGDVADAAAALTQQYGSVQDQQLMRQLTKPDESQGDKTEQNAGSDGDPEVRSDEWHRLRRDNHKEVERRRRETINKNIDELAKIVPNCDKHKGQILKRSIDYIHQLQAESKKAREEYAYGEMLLKQTLSEFTTRNKALQTELEQAWREAEHWKKRTAALEKGT